MYCTACCCNSRAKRYLHFSPFPLQSLVVASCLVRVQVRNLPVHRIPPTDCHRHDPLVGCDTACLDSNGLQGGGRGSDRFSGSLSNVFDDDLHRNGVGRVDSRLLGSLEVKVGATVGAVVLWGFFNDVARCV